MIKDYIKQLEKSYIEYCETQYKFGINTPAYDFYRGMAHATQCTISDLKRMIGENKNEW